MKHFYISQITNMSTVRKFDVIYIHTRIMGICICGNFAPLMMIIIL